MNYTLPGYDRWKTTPPDDPVETCDRCGRTLTDDRGFYIHDGIGWADTWVCEDCILDDEIGE